MDADPSDFRAPAQRDQDFLGAFAVLERDGAILMVQNERQIDGRGQLVWDLPGGQVEPGELLGEALVRELREETGLLVTPGRLLFLQEGEKWRGGRRRYAWRSFFFAAEATGTPTAGGEVLAVRFVERSAVAPLLVAPYHDSFRRWLQEGGSYFHSSWRE